MCVCITMCTIEGKREEEEGEKGEGGERGERKGKRE